MTSDAAADAAAASEADVERADSPRPSAHPDTPELEPIRTGARPTRTFSWSSSRSRSLTPALSQNGYGVSDGLEDEASEDGEPAANIDARLEDKDPFDVGFDGGDSDPMSPRSFSTGRKWLITIIVSSCSFAVTAASSIYTSTYAQMEAEFGNSRIVSILGLSMFVIGIALGPMLFAPLSEFYGRRPVYLVSWSLYVVWIVPQAVAPNITTIIVSRFFDGFAGSTFLAVSGGTVGDLFARHELQAPMAIFSLAPFLGPSTGPIIGGFINFYIDWRWTYYILLIWSFSQLVAIVLLVPETFHPIVLRNKARRIRKETGDDRYKAPNEKVTRSIVSAVGRSLMRPFQLLVYEPMCLCLCILSALLLGILYLFFGAFPLVFTTNHGFNLWQVGLTFTGLGVGLIAAILTDPIWNRVRGRLARKLEEETGVPGASEPEMRLPPVICGAILVPVSIFFFGWTTYSSVHWIVPIVAGGIFGTGNLLCFTGIFTFLVDAYPTYAASALAANAFVRCMFAGAFPLFGNQMYETLGYQWASSLLAFLTLAMVPFPYIFFRHGKKLRSKSRFAKS